MTVILYLPQLVGISRFDCRQTGFGKQLAFVVGKKKRKKGENTHTYSLNSHVHMHDLCMSAVTRYVKEKGGGGEKRNENIHKSYKSNLTLGRRDGADDFAKLQTCQSVAAVPLRGCGSSLLILESLRGGRGIAGAAESGSSQRSPALGSEGTLLLKLDAHFGRKVRMELNGGGRWKYRCAS